MVAAVLAQPSGFRPEMPDLFYQNNITGWGPALIARLACKPGERPSPEAASAAARATIACPATMFSSRPSAT